MGWGKKKNIPLLLLRWREKRRKNLYLVFYPELENKLTGNWKWKRGLHLIHHSLCISRQLSLNFFTINHRSTNNKNYYTRISRLLGELIKKTWRKRKSLSSEKLWIDLKLIYSRETNSPATRWVITDPFISSFNIWTSLRSSIII